MPAKPRVAAGVGQVSPTVADDEEDRLLDDQMIIRQAKWNQERVLVLRVYNYFRIVLSVFLLILFFQGTSQSFVGSFNPGWFQSILCLYLMFNIAIGMATLVSEKHVLRGATAIASVVVFDIYFLSLLLLTSGGVDSGLGYLLVFSVAFGSAMLGGQTSFLFPALATVNGISGELYLHNIGVASGSQHFFEMSMLGISFFVVNLFFQYITRRLEERESDVVNLETLDRFHRIAERSRRELEVSNARFKVLLSSTGEGVLGLDMEGIVTFANPRACELLAIGYTDLVNSNIQQFMLPSTKSGSAAAIKVPKVLQLLGIEALSVYDPDRWQTAGNEAFIVEYSCEATVNKADMPTGAVLLFRNITQERTNEDRLQYLALYDQLTGLSNRSNFQEVLSSAISRSRWSKRSIGILAFDSDHFSMVNEQHGQTAGDAVLKVVAERLQARQCGRVIWLLVCTVISSPSCSQILIKQSTRHWSLNRF